MTTLSTMPPCLYHVYYPQNTIFWLSSRHKPSVNRIWNYYVDTSTLATWFPFIWQWEIGRTILFKDYYIRPHRRNAGFWQHVMLYFIHCFIVKTRRGGVRWSSTGRIEFSQTNARRFLSNIKSCTSGDILQGNEVRPLEVSEVPQQNIPPMI